MYFTSGSDRAFESLMQGKPGFDHYDSGDAGAPEDCGDCRFYRPDWKYQFCVYAECPYQPGKLTALDAVGDRVAGLDAGADDYLPKPFATEELLARVRALGRRPTEWEGGAALHRGDVELRVQDRLLTGPAGAHTLSRRECALLELFLRNPGTTLPRERILLNVWGPDSDVESGNIDNYIHLVRRRLRLVGSRMELVTRRGAGYRLEADQC